MSVNAVIASHDECWRFPVPMGTMITRCVNLCGVQQLLDYNRGAMKKIIVLSIVWTVILVFVFSYPLVRIGPLSAPPPGQPYPPHAGQFNGIALATLIVLVIFAADLVILVILRKMGPLKADVKATIEKFGGNIVIASAGLVGCFLAIAIVGFGGIYMISSLMSR